MKPKIDWTAFWKEFDEWCEKPRRNFVYPDWYGKNGQKAQIQKMVEQRLVSK